MHTHKHTRMQTAGLTGSLCASLMLIPRSDLSVLLNIILGETAFSCQQFQLIISLTVVFNISHENLECRQRFHHHLWYLSPSFQSLLFGCCSAFFLC